jgi:hypothetical protein
MGINGGYSYTASGAYVNDEFNKTNNARSNGGISFNLTPGEHLSLDLRSYVTYRDIRYSINTNQNQYYFSYGGTLTLKWEFIKKTYVEANFDYDHEENNRYDYYQDQPLLNISVRRLLGKKNQYQIRLAAFDLLNESLYTSQSGTQNYYYRTSGSTLGRYYMLSFSYNIRGFQTGVKKDRFF